MIRHKSKLGLFITIFIIQISFIKPSTVQTVIYDDKCTIEENYCKSNEYCLAKVDTSLTLICNDQQDWFKSPDKLIGSSVTNNEYRNNFELKLCKMDVTNLNRNKKVAIRYLVLKINNLNSTDSGFLTYRADVHDTDEICSYNIFIYDDKVAGRVTVKEDFSFDINEKPFISFDVNSFDNNNVEYTFQIESLPIDKLIVNNEVVESKKCKSYEYPSLNCLESEPIKFAKKCINTYNFSISYDFDNKEIYKSLDIQPRVFDHYFGINYPPQVLNKNQTISFDKEDIAATLDCEIECSNPPQVQYKWYSRNGTFLFEKENDSKFVYEFNKTNEKNLIEVHCIASNRLVSSSNESRMDFFLIKNEYATRSGLKEWEIVLIVVCCFIFFLICLSVVLLVCLLTNKNRNGKSSKKKNTKSENSTTTRKNQLDYELSDNPIYGSNNTCVTSHSL